MTIQFSTIESFFLNSSFLILLITTVYYWIKIIFFSSMNITNLSGISTVFNFNNLNSGFFISSNDNQNSSTNTIPNSENNASNQHLGFLGLFIVDFLLTIQLVGRWVESGHFPLSNLYESLLFLAWGIIFFYLWVEFKSNTQFLGILISPIVLCILGFTGFTLPIELQQNKPLVPALQSNWLFMHVSVMMLSYSALLLGCLVSIGYLLLVFFLNKQKNSTNENVFVQLLTNLEKRILTIKTNSTSKSNRNVNNIENISTLNNELVFSNNTSNIVSFTNNQTNSEFPLLNEYTNLFNFFDNLSYRTIGIGFCFLTLGILSGAVWANETWGSYWSWDPKETWALITWLTFAVYLHTRFLQGWKGYKPAIIASFGFFIIWICYIGVNLLGKGLHSYGFLT